VRVGAGVAGLAIVAIGAGLAAWSSHTHASSTTTSRVAAVYLPDPTLHPGAVNKTLDASQLCAAGFTTSSIRPPVSYTTKLKLLELGDGGLITAPSGTTYTVVGEHLPGTIADYELDHLISLEIGGNPEDPKNLWMEPWERRGPDHLAAAGQGAESKDVVENRLHRGVCAATLTLGDAQHEIATDWTTAK
jgi:hypothetical protein